MSDHSWIEAISDEAINEILDGLHDLKGRRLRSSLVNEKWARQAAPLSAWPVARRGLGGGVFLDLVSFCAEADSPDDPNHTPRAQLGAEFSCTCGWRASWGKRFRVGRWWWPTVYQPPGGAPIVLGDGTRVPYYVVCPRAHNGVEDPRHAPSSVTDTAVLACICGAYPGYDELQYLPAV